MKNFTIADARELYGIDSWGAGYFDIDNDGDLSVSPENKSFHKAKVLAIVEEVQKGRLKTPLLLRFPQILASQVNLLAASFQRAIDEYKYKEKYYPVFPVKVNQQCGVVKTLLKEGFDQNLGIEVGSKAELMAALGLSMSENTFITCNGFKDDEYLDMVSLGLDMGKKINVVIEKPFELEAIFRLQREKKSIPTLGFRVKLNAKGSGLWEKSGGSSSKFGLSINQLLHSIEVLREHDLLSQLQMFHFHIGSQITEIRKIKAAINEAVRVYAKCYKMGIEVEYLNMGGGLGVDYDGSKTSSDASVNYSVREYANDVVYNVLEVCDKERVPHPKLVSESGRFLVAYHSMLIVDTRDQYHEMYTDKPEFSKNEVKVIDDMVYINESINVKNYREYYHDSVQRKDEMISLFNLGMLELEDRAKGEWLYWAIAQKAVRFSKTARFVADEFVELEQRLNEKMVCNFSVFQSIPDHWALDQLFPVMPISYLKEFPSRKATLVDITCDSDGEVEKFVDLKDIKQALEVHDIEQLKPYYLAFLMIGAYQDTMGDLHNLFGAVNEAQVFIEENGKFLIKDAKKGDSIGDALELYRYSKTKLLKEVERNLNAQVKKDKIKPSKAKELCKEYESYFNSYPYLS